MSLCVLVMSSKYLVNTDLHWPRCELHTHQLFRLSTIRCKSHLRAFPHSIFKAFLPLSFVELSGLPLISAYAMRFSSYVWAFIKAAIFEFFIAMALFHIIKPLPFKESAIVIHHDSFSVSPGVINLPVIDGLFILFEFEVGRLMQFF